MDNLTTEVANDTLNNQTLENSETGQTLRFTCPNPDCQGHNLVCKKYGVTEVYPILFVKNDLIHWGETETETDGCEYQFECSDCGYVLTDDDGCRFTGEEQMVEWLKKHQT